MRTATTTNVEALLAQAQARLASTAQTAQPSSSGSKATAAEQLGKISPVLAQVHERIAAQSQAATASLSALGSFKSGLDGLGTAAQALSSLTAASTPQAVETALQKLITAYNATLKSGTAVSVGTPGSSAGTVRALRELREAVDGLHLPSAGMLTAQQDGTLSLDTTALAKAFAADPQGLLGKLADAAGQLSSVSTRTLADDSRLSTSLARLGDRAQALKTQQEAVMSTATRLSQLNSTSSWSALALAAYQRS